MGDLATHYDADLAAKCYANQRSSEEAIITHMYNRETHRFNHRWQDKNGTWQLFSVRTIQILFPLLLSTPPPESIVEMLRLLRDENEFGTKYMVPTVSKSEPPYNPVANTLLLWRGPIWGFTNWFIMEGLNKHNQLYSIYCTSVDNRDDLNRIMTKWIEMVKNNGIWEHYNPETGRGYGAEGLGMSCLVVDWMARLGLVQI